MDGITINPSSGWVDLLALYFGSHTGYIGGGLGAAGELSAQPTVVQFDLNETARFSKLGEYRVQVTSARVSRLGVLPRNSGISVKSNEIQLTIIPARKKWQSQTLVRALAVLNGSKPASNETWRKRGEAIKFLRYLGTADAARELALRLNEANLGWDCLLVDPRAGGASADTHQLPAGERRIEPVPAHHGHRQRPSHADLLVVPLFSGPLPGGPRWPTIAASSLTCWQR
ncbi:MAG: hypothetical protein P4K98_01995 [Bryobacteraceae bacterium]|nr:hypothetical protein [Bryobacteraceae bacterium]